MNMIIILFLFKLLPTFYLFIKKSEAKVLGML
jgi:hypothetical protein